MSPVVLGSVGVALLLVAFVLNVLQRLDENGAAYLTMNLVGASLACWYAWVSGLVPFVILEGTWALAAGVRLVSRSRVKEEGSPQGGEPR